MDLNGTQLLTIRGDSMKTQTAFCCYIITILSLILSFLAISNQIPQSLTAIIGTTNCHELTDIDKSGKFCSTIHFSDSYLWTSDFMNITEYNQFLLVRARPIKRLSQSGHSLEKFDLKYSLKVDHLDNDGKYSSVAWSNKSHTTIVECDTIHKDSKDINYACSAFNIFLEPELLSGNYKVEVFFENIDEIDHIVSGIYFDAYRINDEYTGFLISFRYLAFTISLVLSVCYCVNFSSTPKKMRVFEQKYIVVLGVGLNLFNDPFVGINIVSPSNFSIFISIFCSVTFLALILLFWLVMFERVYKENEKKRCKTFSGWKLTIILIFWIFSMASLCSVAFAYLEDPSFHITEDFPLVSTYAITIISLVYLTIGIYIVFCLVKSFQQWKTRIQRHKIFIGFSIFFIILFKIIFLTGAYDYYSLNGPHIVLTLLTCNIYVYVLMYIYSLDDQSRKDLEMDRKRKELEMQHRQDYMYLEDIRKQEFEEEVLNNRRALQQLSSQQQAENDQFVEDIMKGKDKIDLSFDDDDELDDEKDPGLI